MEEELRGLIKELKEKYCCIGFKMETEGAGNSFEEINFIHRLALGHLPLLVKVGGPEARNDIRNLLELGVEGLLAPMVESPYGVVKFVQALKDLAGERYNDLFKAINIETVTAYRQIDDILKQPETKELQHVTIGRGDLSRSIGKGVDDPETMRMTKDITEKAQAAGLLVSVGGAVTPYNAPQVVKDINPDKINTRHVILDARRCENIGEALRKAFEFEMAFLKALSAKYSSQRDRYERRIAELQKRLAQK